MGNLNALFAVVVFIIILCPVFIQVSVWADVFPEDNASIESLLKKGLEDLVEINITLATGTSRPLKLAPAVATVITAEDIEAMGATTLDEALETVPGLHVVPSNGNRLNSSYSIRGILTKQNPQVLLLLDGRPVRVTTRGNRPNTFDMSTANISRIEIVRGPGSALYGADAFAGTINVITKKASEIDGASVGMRLGSFGTTDNWLQYGGKHDGWDVALSLDFLKSDGDKSRIVDADLQTSLDASMGTKSSLAPGPLSTRDRILDTHLRFSNQNWDFRFWGWVQNDGGEGAGGAQALDPSGVEKPRFFMTDLTYRKSGLLPDFDTALGLSYSYVKEDDYIVLFPPGSRLPIGADGNINFTAPAGFTRFPDGVIGHPGATENRVGIDLTSTYRGFEDHVLRLGAGFDHTAMSAFEKKNFGPGVLDGTQAVRNGALAEITGTPNIFLKDVKRDSWHMLLQDEWSVMKRLSLTAGLRYDQYSDFGGTVNPRLALVWEARDDLTTKLLYGRAFRPPSFNEMYFKNNPVNIGNPGLSPETINTYELVFEYRPVKRFKTTLNLFTYNVKGLIEFRPDPGQSTSTAQNAKDQKGHGLELESVWDITEKVGLRGNVAYQRSKDKGTGEVVPDAPGMKAYAGALWKFIPKWSLDGQYVWVGDRHRAAGDTRANVNDYGLVNATLRKRDIAGNLDMAFAVRNLFDTDAREPSQTSIPHDYPMEGRNYWVELRYKF